VPHSIGVDSWSGDMLMRALAGVCEAGLGPVRWEPRAQKHSLDGICQLATPVLALNTICRVPPNFAFGDRLDCVHPNRS
jgi:hypothetical protein